MIAIGTENLSELVYSGLFDLKNFIKKHPEIQYIETSLDYDNDILLKDLIPENITVLSKFSCFENLDVLVNFNKLALGRGKDFDNYCVLLDAKQDWYNDKTEIIIKNLVTLYKVGIYNASLDDITYFKETFGKLDFVELEINPLLYPKTILDYSKANNIKIISKNIFGGKYWAGYLESMFPKGFLSDFARHNSDIQIIPGNDLFMLSRLSGRKNQETDTKLLEYTKDLDKLPALTIPPQKIYGGTEINFPGTIKLKISCGETTDTYSLEKYEPVVEAQDIIWEEKDNLPRNVFSCISRYHAPVFLDEKYNPRWWKKIYSKVAPDFWIIKLIPRHWYLELLVKEHIFWLVSGKLVKIPLAAHQNLINGNI